MSKKVRVLVLRSAGTNCNEETAFAFSRCGAEAEQVHINVLLAGECRLADYHILALAGGFSYGDDIASGRILANELRLKLGNDLKRFIADGKLIIGICNGFQILVKAGILPGLKLSKGSSFAKASAGRPTKASAGRQEATLFNNDSAKFEARWVHLQIENNACVWTKGMPAQIYLPVAHGEGKFIPRDKNVLQLLDKNAQVVFRYCASDGGKPGYPDNPNGSTDDIAGICDPTGRVLGLMPHPERHFLFTQHPFWPRLRQGFGVQAHQGFGGQARLDKEFGDGAKIFENGINYVRENLL